MCHLLLFYLFAGCECVFALFLSVKREKTKQECAWFMLSILNIQPVTRANVLSMCVCVCVPVLYEYECGVYYVYFTILLVTFFTRL